LCAGKIAHKDMVSHHTNQSLKRGAHCRHLKSIDNGKTSKFMAIFVVEKNA